MRFTDKLPQFIKIAVDVKQDEFCCGMLNKVPIVINTETGLTRDGKTITETIINTLPPEVQRE